MIEKFGIPVILEILRYIDGIEPDGSSPMAFRLGDVIAARFPIKERPNEPGPKVRPCVVVAIDHENGTVTVAYGSDVQNRSNLGVDLEITSEPDMIASGLDKPTRFSMHRLADIPLNRSYIDYRRSGRFGVIPETRWVDFEEKRIEGAKRANEMKVVLALFLSGPAAPHGIVLEEGSPPCHTLRAADGFTVDFWIDDPEQFAASVSREMIQDTPLLSATEKAALMTRLVRRSAA